MPTYVALLRGVNVGGKAKVPMAQLRAVFESLDCTGVRTYIQSGNVVFDRSKALTAGRVETAVKSEFGIDTAVMLRSPAALANVLASNPFPDADESKLHIAFMATRPSITKIDTERFSPEEFAVRGTEVYLHLPNGMGRAKLPPYVLAKLGVPTTVRNWNTVTKLVELARG